MNRRQFIGGFGGLVAVSALPAWADDPSQFPSRGKYHRLMLAYQQIEAGATKPFSILHISDTHLSDAYAHEDAKKQELRKNRTCCFGGRQEESLRDSLDWAKANVDYVLHTGDLIDWQSEKNFDLVKKYFGDRMFGALGNHEYSRNMWLDKDVVRDDAYRRETARRVEAVYPFDAALTSTVVNGVNFVCIRNIDGSVAPDQVERFSKEVKKGLPIILCMHVPFYTERIWRAHEKFWVNNGRRFESSAVPALRGDYLKQQDDETTRDFIAFLKGEKLLKGILAGHLHFTIQDRFSPTAMEYVIGGNYLFHGQEILFT